MRRPADGSAIAEFIEVDLADPESIDRAVAAVERTGRRAVQRRRGVLGDRQPAAGGAINFLGTRQFTEALLDQDAAGLGDRQRVVAGGGGLPGERAAACAGLLATGSMADGHRLVRRRIPRPLADGGYRLSKEAIILYAMSTSDELGAPRHPDQLHRAGRDRDADPRPAALGLRAGLSGHVHQPLGRVSDPAEQAAVLVFLGSRAASYITGQVIWVDGGNVAERIAGESRERRHGAGELRWPAHERLPPGRRRRPQLGPVG